MGEVADLVDKERTAGAARLRPALDNRCKHEVVNDQLAAPLEHIEQIRLAVRPLEQIVLSDLAHREPASLRSQRVSRTGSCFFFDQQVIASGMAPGGRPQSWGCF